MADNYLERKMEEHRNGGARQRPRHTTPMAGARPGHMDVKFAPRRVFVTGGANGIGRSIVTQLRNVGCKVAFCDVDSEAGTELARSCGAQFHPLDVCDTSSLLQAMDKVFRAWGDIDVVINNVGISEFKSLEDITIEEFDRVMAINVRPVFVTAHTLLKHRVKLPYPNSYGGRIINISSIRSRMSESGTEAYSASKGAVASLTHALMMSLAPYHITVNSISPGWIVTDSEQPLRDIDHMQHPSGRVGRPEDVARICLFLMIDDNDFINGEDICVDGGMTRRMIYQ